ncbi:MAG: CDP-alcohol phosphatidyltransferase family protein [Chlamydiota bacterium]
MCLATSGYCDTLDGSLARLQNRPTSLGTVYDITSDRLVELATVLGLYAYAPQERHLLSLLMLGSILICITTFLVVGIFSENTSKKSFSYSAGIMERTEAFIFFSAMILLPQHFNNLAAIFTIMVFITALIRIREFRRHHA